MWALYRRSTRSGYGGVRSFEWCGRRGKLQSVWVFQPNFGWSCCSRCLKAPRRCSPRKVVSNFQDLQQVQRWHAFPAQVRQRPSTTHGFDCLQTIRSHVFSHGFHDQSVFIGTTYDLWRSLSHYTQLVATRLDEERPQSHGCDDGASGRLGSAKVWLLAIALPAHQAHPATFSAIWRPWLGDAKSGANCGRI